MTQRVCWANPVQASLGWIGWVKHSLGSGRVGSTHFRPGLTYWMTLVECWRSQNSMADSSTTTALILNQITEGCWSRGQLRSGLKDVSLASKLRISLTLVRVVFLDTVVITELDAIFLLHRSTDIAPLCAWWLGSMPATQRYKVRPCRIKTHEIAVFCRRYIS